MSRGGLRATTCWSGWSDLFVRRGVPQYLRSDNSSEFMATKLRYWLARVGVTTLLIEPGTPWENGYVESFNCELRDELLAREPFDTLLETKALIERGNASTTATVHTVGWAIGTRRWRRSSVGTSPALT